MIMFYNDYQIVGKALAKIILNIGFCSIINLIIFFILIILTPCYFFIDMFLNN
jgi:hypothetical protein